MAEYELRAAKEIEADDAYMPEPWVSELEAAGLVHIGSLWHRMRNTRFAKLDEGMVIGVWSDGQHVLAHIEEYHGVPNIGLYTLLEDGTVVATTQTTHSDFVSRLATASRPNAGLLRELHREGSFEALLRRHRARVAAQPSRPVPASLAVQAACELRGMDTAEAAGQGMLLWSFSFLAVALLGIVVSLALTIGGWGSLSTALLALVVAVGSLGVSGVGALPFMVPALAGRLALRSRVPASQMLSDPRVVSALGQRATSGKGSTDDPRVAAALGLLGHVAGDASPVAAQLAAELRRLEQVRARHAEARAHHATLGEVPEAMDAQQQVLDDALQAALDAARELHTATLQEVGVGGARDAAAVAKARSEAERVAQQARRALPQG